jgi:hypothetical protein
MIYTYNSKHHRIDIHTATGVVVAFIEQQYLHNYPYFNHLNDDEPF